MVLVVCWPLAGAPGYGPGGLLAIGGSPRLWSWWSAGHRRQPQAMVLVVCWSLAAAQGYGPDGLLVIGGSLRLWSWWSAGHWREPRAIMSMLYINPVCH